LVSPQRLRRRISRRFHPFFAPIVSRARFNSHLVMWPTVLKGWIRSIGSRTKAKRSSSLLLSLRDYDPVGSCTRLPSRQDRGAIRRPRGDGGINHICRDPLDYCTDLQREVRDFAPQLGLVCERLAACGYAGDHVIFSEINRRRERRPEPNGGSMDWTTPSLCEVAVGMEIASYATAGL
jgi:hypothetical protein